MSVAPRKSDQQVPRATRADAGRGVGDAGGVCPRRRAAAGGAFGTTRRAHGRATSSSSFPATTKISPIAARLRDLEEDHVQTIRGEVVEIDGAQHGFRQSHRRRVGEAGRRVSARDVVQPAVHAREVSRGAARAAFGQAAISRRAVGDAAPAGDLARWRRRPARDAAACRCIRSPRGSRNIKCGGWWRARSRTSAMFWKKFFPSRC